MKGFWDTKTNNWDYVGYTAMYNQVYDALKSVNPRIQVGGPYLILEGSGTQLGDPTQQVPILPRDWQVLDYWLQHKHGADFICLDRTAKADHDPLTYPPDQMLAFTGWLQSIAEQIRARTKLPIWWSESRFDSGPWNYQAAGLASMMLHELKGGSAVTLSWQPQGVASDKYGGNWQALWSDTRLTGGGQPFPYYWAFRAFHQDFGPGTKLYRATSSSPDVEVLASASHILLINKRDGTTVVKLNGSPVSLAPYQVRVLNQ
ncbi:MAG TPA: hypothetical protein VKX16_16555, partial [Chloroflexota bacterium]|nr:hypothetical protein [Chloroflexota bacterium]